MNLSTEKRLLQITVSLACIVPLSAGLTGVIKGASFLGGGTVDMDSHIRYLSGLLLAVGLGFLAAIPGIERHTGRFRLLTLIVFIGGMGRLFGVLEAGLPGGSMCGGLVMELVVTPLLCFWQNRVARKFQSLATVA